MKKTLGNKFPKQLKTTEEKESFILLAQTSAGPRLGGTQESAPVCPTGGGSPVPQPSQPLAREPETGTERGTWISEVDILTASHSYFQIFYNSQNPVTFRV